MAHILYNALVTPDGTLLESLYRHHYSSHTDSVTGEYYFIDGGNDTYFRTSVNKEPSGRICITTDDPHEVKREYSRWGSYGKNGDEALHFIKLKDLTLEHIEAILDTQEQLKGTHIEKLLKSEVQFRLDNLTKGN